MHENGSNENEIEGCQTIQFNAVFSLIGFAILIESFSTTQVRQHGQWYYDFLNERCVVASAQRLFDQHVMTLVNTRGSIQNQPKVFTVRKVSVEVKK